MYEPVVPEHASIPLNVPLSVSMVNFESPTRFWLRLACSKAPFIKHFVRGCERHLYSAEIGQYCVADTRHTVVDLARAFVTDVFRNTAGVHVSAEVQCVDYGLTLVLGLDRLFPLSVEDARTPCVAILCRLHRVATCTRQPPQWRLPANSELEAVFVGVSDTVSFTDSAYSLCGEWEWEPGHPTASADQEALHTPHRCPDCDMATRPSAAHLFWECQRHAQQRDHHLRAVRVSSYEEWIRPATGSMDSDRAILDSLLAFAKDAQLLGRL
ncbi:uncharacterized protein LOC142572699 isoform X2 [Dermacentor variabilis]|uniref:uncharacterized protein LOC142572699 isoform X2 n=1 Tax=Dermacentor variabilis TaxID=34621 RepID=UPI003F5C676F